MPRLGHIGSDSKHKSPLTHLVSLGSVHPHVPDPLLVVFQGKVIRALVVGVGGQAGGVGQEDLACVSVSPFYIFLSGLQGVSVALQPRQGRWGWWLACISSCHGSCRAIPLPVFWRLSKSFLHSFYPTFLPFQVHLSPEQSY